METPGKSFVCYAVYQTQKTMFDKISKHCEESLKYDT